MLIRKAPGGALLYFEPKAGCAGMAVFEQKDTFVPRTVNGRFAPHCGQ